MNPILFAEFRKAGFSVEEINQYWGEYKKTFGTPETAPVIQPKDPEPTRINKPRRPDEELQMWRDLVEQYVFECGVAGAEYKDIYRALRADLEAAGYNCGIRGTGYAFLYNRATDLLKSGKLVRQAGVSGCNARWFHKEIVVQTPNER